MITLTAFRWVPPFARGLVRDLRVRWALEESGTPYRVKLIGPDDQSSAAYRELQPFGQVPQVALECLPVVPPRLAVDPCRCISLQAEICNPQAFDLRDVVEESGEPLLPVSSCRLPYPLERVLRAGPALRPEHVALGRIPLGPPPSLHHLRRRLPGLVRWLPRYYEAV